MNHELNGLARQYQAALRKRLKPGPQASSAQAQDLGRKALTLGVDTLDLLRIHEQALITLVLPTYSPSTRDGMVRRAGSFFAEALTPIEKTHRAARETNVRRDQLNRALRQRSVALAAANQQLKLETVQRKVAEESLRKSEHHYARMLAQSRQMQEQLRLLSRQLLSAQEEERKKISRELHDVIAQTLTSINVRLATLKQKAAANTKGLERSIACTQALVEHSVDIVHQFARELRPAVLDDVGLIPALHTFMKHFKEQTGIHVSLSAASAVEQVNGDKRTALYRVTQEALTNVARHARASRAEVKIQNLNGAIYLRITDNGRGFPTERTLHSKKRMRLGLLGMRERVEMVNGSFSVESALGKGTIIQAQIPLTAAMRGEDRKTSDKANRKPTAGIGLRL